MKRPILPLFFVLILLVLGLPTWAGMNLVSGLFSEAHYDEARQRLDNSQEGSLPGEQNLWGSRLATDPAQAEALLAKGLEDPSLPESTRVGMALQLAQLHFSRGEFNEANDLLSPLVTEATTPLPGEVYLLAGLTLRTSGNLQAAREMLASVKPMDPAFGAARYYLGDISLELGDPELAQRYFESGEKVVAPENQSRLQAGQWRALRAMGQDQDSDQILAHLKKSSPGCLALVEIGRAILQEEDEDSARVALATQEEPTQIVTSLEDNTGRYSLQIGAFSDRSLALEFKKNYLAQLPGLTITEVRDSRGQFLYKLRFGSFVNPAQARTEAQKKKKSLGMNVIVVDLGLASGTKR